MLLAITLTSSMTCRMIFSINKNTKHRNNFIHLFISTAKELQKVLPFLVAQIVPDGMIWVSWPKKASKVPTDVTEDTIRGVALKSGLVDIKVCTVDDTWSALKLVIPIKDRKA